MTGKKEDRVKLLFELVKNARRSDRELAKALKISQPTVTRKRAMLEKEGLVREYTIIPDLAKIDYEFVALTFLAFTESKPELVELAREWTGKQPCVVFAADGEGLGMNSVMISIHQSYASFSKLITKLRQDWQPNLKDMQSFITSLTRSELFIKQFSFKYLEGNK